MRSALALLALAAVLAAAAMLPGEWTAPMSKPPAPLAVELLGPGEPVDRPAIDAALGGTIRLIARALPMEVRNELVTVEGMPPRHFATILVRDGCLRLDWRDAPLVVLPPGARLVRDRDGDAAIVYAEAPAAKVGEPIWWEGRTVRLGSDEVLSQLRARCGPGSPVYVGLVQSVAASQAGADRAAARNFAERYGVPPEEALKRVQACRAGIDLGPGGDPSRMIDNPCGMVPPPPVEDPRDCPPGTSLSGGLCRTPEGFVRPIPGFDSDVP